MRVIKLLFAFLFIFVPSIWAMENEPTTMDGFEIGQEPSYHFFTQVKYIKTTKNVKLYDARKSNHSYALFDNKILEACIWIGEPTEEIFEKEKKKYYIIHGRPDTISIEKDRTSLYWKGKINTVILEFTIDSIRYSIVNQELFLDFMRDFVEKAKGGKTL